MLETKKCASCGREFRSEADFLTGTSRWRICSSGHLWFNCTCQSTLIITKGKYPWYSPEKVMSEEASAVFNKLTNLKDLPHIPSQILEIQRLIKDPDINPKTVAEAIKQDPLSAAHLISIAENIRSNRNPGHPPFRSIEFAVVYLGMKAVSELILASGLQRLKFPPSAFDFDQFWHEAHLCGAIAEYLNKHMDLQLSQDEVYLAASMCNLGKLVTTYTFPALASKIQADVQAKAQPVSWRAAENSYKFPDHRVLGEIAVTIWGLPTYIAEAARRHHDSLKTEQKNFALYELVAVANQLVHWVTLAPSRIEYDILESFYKKTGSNERDIERIVVELTRLNNTLKLTHRPQ